ncbi:MAG: hypothetical protein V7720_10800 [Halioglobus sp.]
MRRLAGKLRTSTTLGISALLLTFALAPAAAMAPVDNYTQVQSDEIFSRKEQRYGHLEYFGFYASASQHWNNTEELSGFTNLTWIAASNLDIIVQRMQQAENAGVEVVLSLQPFAFHNDFSLRPDYLHRISQLQQRLQYEGLMHNIAMVYPVDEPLLHAASSKNTNRTQIRQDIAQLNHDVSELFPETPIGVIFNHREIVRKGFTVPESYSWIGFDCYASLYDCKGKPFTSLYSDLLKKMSSEQKLIAVPESWMRYRDYQRKDLETSNAYQLRKKFMIRNLERRLRHHYEIALSEPRFVAFVPFLWSMEAAEGQEQSSGFGVDQFDRRFPEGGAEFRQMLMKIGGEITRGNYTYPNMSLKQTEPNLRRPWNGYEVEILDISETGVISAWSVNRALPHKSLRMQVVIQSEGQDVYVSKLKRSFILDRSLQSGVARSLPGLGVHGYRHSLPKSVVGKLRGKTAIVSVRAYGDRASRKEYLETSAELRL